MRESKSTGYAGMDDINIPVVALTVGLFAVVVLVVIVFLEAFFRNVDAREMVAKTRVQEDKTTELGSLLAMQRAELRAGLNPLRDKPASATGSGPASAATSAPARKWMSIDAAMQGVSGEYENGGVR
jgi:hypothetical protein